MIDLEQFQKNIHYKFKNPQLLIKALTHSSYINEHNLNREDCNERIEFLGDAVLELVSSEFLYNAYPDMPEGSLTKLRAALVCEPTLAIDAKDIDLSTYILLGKGEDKNQGRFRDSIVSDALESVIGAIYLDGGLKSAKQFILTFIMNDIEDKQIYHDAKTALQEFAQERFENTPEYVITGSSGPDHAKTFYADVIINGEVKGKGIGCTKKNAEQSAALAALKELKGIG